MNFGAIGPTLALGIWIAVFCLSLWFLIAGPADMRWAKIAAGSSGLLLCLGVLFWTLSQDTPYCPRRCRDTMTVLVPIGKLLMPIRQETCDWECARLMDNDIRVEAVAP